MSEIRGHYGVFCDICHAPVEYADLTSHKCYRPQVRKRPSLGQYTHDSKCNCGCNFRLRPEYQERRST